MASDKSRFATPYSSSTASSIVAVIIDNIEIESILGYCVFDNPASREAIADDCFSNNKDIEGLDDKGVASLADTFSSDPSQQMSRLEPERLVSQLTVH
jgi:hypothetical protein